MEEPLSFVKISKDFIHAPDANANWVYIAGVKNNRKVVGKGHDKTVESGMTSSLSSNILVCHIQTTIEK
jgi:hypothetical protein